MEAVPPISKEFLEENVGRKVKSFTIKPGSNVGDNFMSVLYSIDVQVLRKEQDNNNETETLHLLAKCYPSHPARQRFLNKSNIFWNELSVYKILLPELQELAKKAGMADKKLFPPLIGGNAVNFQKLKQLDDKSHEGKVFCPFEIYLLMTDIRKTWGFRMGDRISGLGLDEMELAVNAMAQLHAFSWGYKKVNGLNTLSEKFEFLDVCLTEEHKSAWLKMIAENLKLAADTIKKSSGNDSPLAERTQKLDDYANMFLGIAFLKSGSEEKFTEAHRCKPTDDLPPEEPWRVLMHGDCWTNNLLFRYNEETSKAEEVVLVDLQMMREHCPTLDLVYLIYCSTTTEFRQEYLNKILEIYHDEFTNCCNLIGVRVLPNFNIEELTRRFHRSKILGFLLAAVSLPLLTKDAKDILDMETVQGEKMEDVLKVFGGKLGDNTIYAKRIVALAQELYEDGVL